MLSSSSIGHPPRRGSPSSAARSPGAPSRKKKPGPHAYLVPFRSLASEVYDHFHDLLGSTNVRLRISTGDHREPIRPDESDLIVATYESFAALVRRTGLAQGTVIADEIHLIADDHRGQVVEGLLSRLLASGRIASLCGLSAVVENGKDLADWLGIDFLEGTPEDRPVVLELRHRLVQDLDKGLKGAEGLAELLPTGVAFHHAGLVKSLRPKIEGAYRDHSPPHPDRDADPRRGCQPPGGYRRWAGRLSGRCGAGHLPASSTSCPVLLRNHHLCFLDPLVLGTDIPMRTLSMLSLVVYSIAALNSLFVTLVYFFSNRGNKALNRLLAVIFFICTFRVGKSVGIHFFESFHDSAHAIWYAGLAYSAVVLYLYVSQVSRSPLSRRGTLLHLVLPTSIFLVILLYRRQVLSTWPQFDAWIYRLVCFCFVSYLFLSYREYREAVRASFGYSPVARWVGLLLLFFAGEGVLVLFYLIVPYYVPDVESFYFSLAVYLFIFVEMRWKLVSRAHQRVQCASEPGETLSRRLAHAIENEKLYLTSGITLPVLAKRIGTTPNELSRFINTRFSRNFNDFVNAYRIQEAKRYLKDPESRTRTIADIAMECGFNSISVFNQAFKKMTGKTPSQFQAEL